MDETIWSCLYSAVVIEPWERVYRAFEYACSHPRMPGTDVAPTQQHTNMPRSGAAGLPRNWKMDVERITVVSNRSMDALSEFLIDTSLFFRVHGETVLRGNGRGLSEPRITISDCVPFHLELITPEETPRDVPTALPDIDPIVSRLPPGAWPVRQRKQLQDLQHLKTEEIILWYVLEGPTRVVII